MFVLSRIDEENKFDDISTCPIPTISGGIDRSDDNEAAVVRNISAVLSYRTNKGLNGEVLLKGRLGTVNLLVLTLLINETVK